MSEQKSALLGLLGVAVIWGISYVMSAYLLQAFSPVFLSFVRISMTCVLLMLVMFKARGLQHPTKADWLLLLASSVFGTMLQQPFYFIGLRHSTAANASLIYAVAPLATIFLEAIFLKVQVSLVKIIGAMLGFVGVLVIVGFGGKAFGISLGDLYLLIAMLGLSISLLFIPSLSKRMSPYSISIYSTIVGSTLMLPIVGGEKLFGQIEISRDWLMWLLLTAAGILTAIAGVWWVRGVAVVGAGTAALFNNIPPVIALLTGYFILGDEVHLIQILGGIVVLAGVFISNQQYIKGDKLQS